MSVFLLSELLDACQGMSAKFITQFGLKIKEVRERLELSQEDLADLAGLHRTHISLIERGQRSARLETIEKLAVALRVQPSELIPQIVMPKK